MVYASPQERTDPYVNFKFRVKWKDKYVAGVSKVSGLTKTTEVEDLREDGSPGGTVKIPGQTDYSPVTLERGLTFDVEFEQWANKIWYYSNTTKLVKDVSLNDFRENIIIELYNEAGQKVVSYDVDRCWPSEYTAMPELEGPGNAVAIQSLTLQNEGWTRDVSIKEPTAPSFTKPSS